MYICMFMHCCIHMMIDTVEEAAIGKYLNTPLKTGPPFVVVSKQRNRENIQQERFGDSF